MGLKRVISKTIMVFQDDETVDRCRTVVFIDGMCSATYPTLNKESAFKLAKLLSDNDDPRPFLRSISSDL